MTDITGKLVFNKTENGLAKKYELNTESLSNGMYVLKIQGGPAGNEEGKCNSLKYT